MNIFLATVSAVVTLKFVVESAGGRMFLKSNHTSMLPKSCNRFVRIKSKSIPFQSLQKLYSSRPNDVQFYSSPLDGCMIIDILHTKIKGSSYTPWDIFTLVNRKLKTCQFYIYGGAVRDIVHGKEIEDINDVDVISSCTPEAIISVCKNDDSLKNYCYQRKISGGKSIAIFGDPEKKYEKEAMDISSTEEPFDKSMYYLEYTPNSVVFDPGTDLHLFFSLTKDALMDACHGRIGIPVEEYWDSWATSENTINNGRKIYRFWKLLVKKYTPKEDKVKEFIIRTAMTYVNNKNNWKAMKYYYCTSNFGTLMAKQNDPDTNRPYFFCPSSEDNCNKNEKAFELRDMLKDDLGWSVPYCGDPNWEVNKIRKLKKI